MQCYVPVAVLRPPPLLPCCKVTDGSAQTLCAFLREKKRKKATKKRKNQE